MITAVRAEPRDGSAGIGRFKPYPAYKDSGIEWLGRIPAHWSVRRLKVIASVELSNVDKKTYEGDEPVRLCNYTHVYGNERLSPDMDFMPATATAEQIGRLTPREGDVLITKDSESWNDIAVAALVGPGDWRGVVCGYHLALVRHRDPGLGPYLARAFSSIGVREQFHVSANGITRFALGGDAIRTALFPVPPAGERQAIVAFLDRETTKIDALAAKKERLIELLMEKRAALTTRAVTKGLDPDARMKHSGIEWLGEIPAHWRVEKNRWLFRESDRRSKLGDEELLTVSHLTGVTRRSEKNVTMIEPESHEGYKLCSSGELAINTMWAWMGALGIARENGMVSPSYNVYHFSDRELDPLYYDYLCRTSRHVMELARMSKGIWKSRLRLYPEDFFGICTPIPPGREQSQIVAHLDHEVRRIDGLLCAIEGAIGQLMDFRSALVSAAVTGKIDVREGTAA